MDESISAGPVAGPSTLKPPQTPNGQTKKRRKKKSKSKSTVTSGVTTEAEVEVEGSGSSTPAHTSGVNGDGDDTAAQNRKKKRKSKEKDRSSLRRRKNGDAETATVTNRRGGFKGGEDFIALLGVESDEEEDVEDVGQKGKGKEKENRDRDRDREDRDRRSRRKRSRSRSRSRSRERDRDRERDRGRKGKRRERSPEHDREWDRGKRRERERSRDRYRDYDRDRERRRDRYDSSSSSSSSKRTPWLEGLRFDGCNNVAEVLHTEVEAFTKYISPSPVEDEIRSLLVDMISSAIKSRYSDAQVYPFGSYATKLYLPSGDIDLVVLSETMAEQMFHNKQQVLRLIADTMRRKGIADNIQIVAKAKVPIVKFVARHGLIPVDISINQPNGVGGAKIINGFLHDMHVGAVEGKQKQKQNGQRSQIDALPNGSGSMALRSLVLITKMFLSQRGMNEVYTGGLGSYSIVCLVISFLQMHPKIRRGEIDPDKNLGVLLIEFFELYGKYFNYQNTGISIRAGGTYYGKRQRGWFVDWKTGLLSIEDPADPTNDISSGSYNFPKVKATFAGAFEILRTTLFMKSEILSSRRSGSAVRLRESGYRPEDLGVLSYILDVTQEVINQRRVVQEVYDQRVLHKMLGVDPRPVVVTMTMGGDDDEETTSGRSGRNRNGSSEARTVAKTVWSVSSGSDTESGDDGDVVYLGSKRKDKEDGEVDEDEDEGRYGIGAAKPPPAKRQKTGPGPGKEVPVYFVDGDSEGASEEEDEDSVVLDEEAEYDLEEREKPASQSNDRDKRRSYWLSKGIGAGAVEDIDSD
ncbi:hypothetical protein AAF712_015568 [Marasmius tenuissimus]|uniref:polynucleotide adenylyltransferase n=1 Tax=Marasmius tenuissimus TaxID=585030 RepID=A0ABR2Z983_9AGAR